MQKETREENIIEVEEQLSTKVQVEVQQSTKVQIDGRSTMKGNGDQEGRVGICSNEKMRNLRQNHTFGERY